MTRKRLLLLELTAAGPQRDQQAAFFPFYKGFAEQNGFETLWLRSGAAPSPALARRVAAFAPTYLATNAAIAPELLAAGRAVLTTAEEMPPPRAKWSSALARVMKRERLTMEQGDALMGRLVKTGWFADWLGLPPGDERWFVGGVEPRYDAVLFDAEAREHAPFLTILGGVSCDYRADLRRNPHFQGVDLSGCLQRAGCSFCSSDMFPTSAMDPDPIGLARTQFSALVRDAGAGGRFEMRDIRLFKRMADFTELILSLDLPAAEFHFAPRIDDLLKAGGELERALPALAARGHRVILFRMGLEHFSPTENARFNKGLTLEQVDRGTALAERLRLAHPGHFDYARPLGYIAFTPWTTLEDLEVSLAEGIKRGFAPQSPWLYAVLELEGRTAITALARHEGGILRANFDDAAMTYHLAADHRQRPGLLAWRFKDRRTAAACAVIVRACALSLRGVKPDAVFAGDELYEWLRAYAAGQGLDLGRPDLFAAALVAAMKAAPAARDKKKLIRAAFARLPRRPVGAR